MFLFLFLFFFLKNKPLWSFGNKHAGLSAFVIWQSYGFMFDDYFSFWLQEPNTNQPNSIFAFNKPQFSY